MKIGLALFWCAGDNLQEPCQLLLHKSGALFCPKHCFGAKITTQESCQVLFLCIFQFWCTLLVRFSCSTWNGTIFCDTQESCQLFFALFWCFLLIHASFLHCFGAALFWCAPKWCARPRRTKMMHERKRVHHFGALRWRCATFWCVLCSFLVLALIWCVVVWWRCIILVQCTDLGRGSAPFWCGRPG